MNKLRQSLRRRKPAYVPEASRPHQWQADEDAVRKGTCSFPVRVSGRGEGCARAGLRALGVMAKDLSFVPGTSYPQRAVKPAVAGPHGLSPSDLGLKTNTHFLVPGKGSLGVVLPGSPRFVGAHNFQRTLEGRQNFVAFAKPSSV